MAHQLCFAEPPETMNEAIPFSVEETNGRHCLATSDVRDTHRDTANTKPRIKIIVKYGNIEQQKADVLSAPLLANTLNLYHLHVTRSLQFAAGDKFSNLFSRALNNRTYLEAGSLFEMPLSESYSLKCKSVIFIALNNWTPSTSSTAEGKLRTGIRNLLEQCNMKNVESIAMSAMGTGVALAFPPQKTATIIGEEIKCFVERNPNTTIKECRLVIKKHPHNEIIFIAYRETLLAMDLGDRIIVCNEEGGIFPRAQRGESIQKNIGLLSVFVVYGDIVEESTNAIVNSTDFKKWIKGSVAHAIFSVTGTDIIQEAHHGHKAGNKVVMTHSGNLKCDWVLHCDCKGNLETIRKHTDEIFQICNDTGLRSLSIPAFGTGQCRMCPKSVAKTLMEAILDLAQKKRTAPSVVRLITYNPFIYRVFCAEVQKHF